MIKSHNFWLIHMLATCLFLSVSPKIRLAAAEPISQSSSVEKTKAKIIGRSDIDEFCAKSINKTQPGTQFNGKPASAAVLELRPGRYRVAQDGELLLFPNSHYLLKVPGDATTLYGTDGDDLLFSGGIVGGCSSEQLSEAIERNGLQLDLFQLVKPYS